MPESQSPDDEAMARFLAGESPPAERAELQARMDRDPHHAAEFELLRRATAGLGRDPSRRVDVEAAWRRVAPQLGETRRPWLRVTAMAAVLALVALGGFWAWRQSSALPSLVYAAPVGSPQVIEFDGGRMVLAPRSTLTARHRAGARPEEVRLEGEAYFELSHDAARPFRVRVGDAEVRDLGTIFTVRGGAGQPVSVLVLEGVVSLRSQASSRDSAIVPAGSRGRLDPDGALTTSATPGTVRPSWVDGRLEFSDATMAEVQAELRRWYGLELRLGDSALANRHLTATIQGEPASRVLEIIALTLGASVERRGDTAVIRPATDAPSAQ